MITLLRVCRKLILLLAILVWMALTRRFLRALGTRQRLQAEIDAAPPLASTPAESVPFTHRPEGRGFSEKN